MITSASSVAGESPGTLAMDEAVTRRAETPGTTKGEIGEWGASVNVDIGEECVAGVGASASMLEDGVEGGRGRGRVDEVELGVGLRSSGSAGGMCLGFLGGVGGGDAGAGTERVAEEGVEGDGEKGGRTTGSGTGRERASRL